MAFWQAGSRRDSCVLDEDCVLLAGLFGKVEGRGKGEGKGMYRLVFHISFR